MFLSQTSPKPSFFTIYTWQIQINAFGLLHLKLPKKMKNKLQLFQKEKNL
jgi:hypothetical protein